MIDGVPAAVSGEMTFKANTLEQTFTRLYQRSPSPRERAAAEAFVKGREADPAVWTQYAQALLVGNEMQFID
jgi:hypothetical protein